MGDVASDHPVLYCRVYWENTSADPFTQAQLKEFTLARGFKPGFHGATTLPIYSHLTRGASRAPSANQGNLEGAHLYVSNPSVGGVPATTTVVLGMKAAGLAGQHLWAANLRQGVR